MQTQYRFSIEQPVPCKPPVADYNVLLSDMSIIRYECVYKNQLNAFAEFERSSGLNKIKRDDILVELFRSRRSHRNRLKIVFPDLDIDLFLDNAEIKIQYDMDGFVFPVMVAIDAHKNPTPADWNFIINEFLQKPLEHVFKLTGLLDRLNFTIKRDNILALHCYDVIVRETDQVIRREHGYGLMDLVLSFAGIHPRKPDLFYQHELVVLK